MRLNNRNKKHKVCSILFEPVNWQIIEAYKESIELLTGLDIRVKNQYHYLTDHQSDFFQEPGDDIDLCLSDIEPGDEFDLVRSPMTCLWKTLTPYLLSFLTIFSECSYPYYM